MQLQCTMQSPLSPCSLLLTILSIIFGVGVSESGAIDITESTTSGQIRTNGTGPTQPPNMVDAALNPIQLLCVTQAVVSHHYNRMVPPNINRRQLQDKKGNCANSTDNEQSDYCPIIVVNKMDLLQIKEIDEDRGSILMLMIYRQYWTDKRLLKPAEFTDACPNISQVNNDSAAFEPDTIDKEVWLPDVYINRIEDIYKPEILMKAQTFEINRRSRTKYTMFGVFTLSCSMDFHNFPMDVQYCPMYLESWRLSEDFQKLVWALKRPIGVQKAYSLDQFLFAVRVLDISNIQYMTGNFSRLGVVLIFSRELQFYVLQIYFPTVLFIIISWLTFIIPHTYAQGRIILTITTMLTLAALFSLVSMHSPATSYPKAIDVWMFVCLTFVFAAVVDCLVNIRLLFVVSQSYKQNLGFLTPVSVALVENRQVFEHFFGSSSSSSSDGGGGGAGGEVDAAPSEFFDVASRADLAAPASSGSVRPILRSSSGAAEHRRSGALAVNFASEPATAVDDRPAPPPEQERLAERTRQQRWDHRASKFEKCSMVLYPVAFLLFNVCYWAYYLTASQPPADLVEVMRRGFTPEPRVIEELPDGSLHRHGIL